MEELCYGKAVPFMLALPSQVLLVTSAIMSPIWGVTDCYGRKPMMFRASIAMTLTGSIAFVPSVFLAFGPTLAQWGSFQALLSPIVQSDCQSVLRTNLAML